MITKNTKQKASLFFILFCPMLWIIILFRNQFKELNSLQKRFELTSDLKDLLTRQLKIKNTQIEMLHKLQADTKILNENNIKNLNKSLLNTELKLRKMFEEFTNCKKKLETLFQYTTKNVDRNEITLSQIINDTINKTTLSSKFLYDLNNTNKNLTFSSIKQYTEREKSKLEQNLSKESEKHQINPPKFQKNELEEHKYVSNNSIHFHRKESSNKLLEFQRDNFKNFEKNESNLNEIEKNNISNDSNMKLNNTLSMKEKEQYNINDKIVDYRKDEVDDKKSLENYKEMPLQ